MELREGTASEAGVSQRQVERIRTRIQEWVDSGIHQAIVVVAARRGVIFLHEACGKLTPEVDAPEVTRDTIFPLSSLTKPIIATAVMQLVDDGRVGLTRAVQDYIPEFAGKGKEDVLVHHLLTHTSGLRSEDHTAFMETQRGVVQIPPPEPTAHPLAHQQLCLSYAVPLWKPPGEEMAYCNLNYLLLAELLRRVSGQAVETYLQERIFTPLGLTDTFPSFPAALEHRYVLRPASAPQASLPGLARRPQIAAAMGAGGALSTALDMAVFGQMFLNGGSYGGERILSRAAVREMTRNQIPGIGTTFFGEHHAEAGWGYGWSVDAGEKWKHSSPPNPGSWNHVGAGGVALKVDPAAELVSVYFSVILHWAPAMLSRGDLFGGMVRAAVE